MSSVDFTDALVPTGVRVPQRPGVTLISAPTSQEAKPAAPTPPPPSSTTPARQGTQQHTIQPQTTDAVVPPGVHVLTPPGVSVIHPYIANVPKVTGAGASPVRGGSGINGADSASPTGGILGTMLRAGRETSVGPATLQPGSHASPGNSPLNRGGIVPGATRTSLSEGDISFAILGSANSLGQVRVQVHVDSDAGALGSVEIKVAGKVVPQPPLDLFQNTHTVLALPRQTIEVTAIQSSARIDAEPPKDPQSDGAVHVQYVGGGETGIFLPSQVARPSTEQSTPDLGLSIEPKVSSARATVVDANGSVSLKRG